ncbi:MAG: ATP-dependent DNA helicase DinG [Neisseriaceae bacterium]|nr:ATP-dependent DNA helicase DinG [Neisseriaceae bacterium]
MLTEQEKSAIQTHYKALSNALNGFRPRPSQRKMIAEIAKTLSQVPENNEEDDTPFEQTGESIVVIEGPTGVGKSLAYLLSGSILAQTRGKKLLVSSATIALQEQLVYRDLPFLAENSGIKISFALAKGRGRYLCPYRLYQITQNSAQKDLGFDTPFQFLPKSKTSKEDKALLHEIADQFEARTFDGDRDTWAGDSISTDLWQKINNDRHSCLKNDCPNRAECPFFKAREVLDNVDIIVANHDLLLSDIDMGGGVILPPPNICFYCIDEAHHLPDKAISRFAAEHSLADAEKFLESFPSFSSSIAPLIDKIDLVDKSDNAASELLQHFKHWETLLGQSDAFPLDSDNDETVWLWENGVVPDELADLVENTSRSAIIFSGCLNKLQDALSNARQNNQNNNKELDKVSTHFTYATTVADSIYAVWKMLAKTVSDNEPPLAKWIVLERKDKLDYRFCVSPVSAAQDLADKLWRQCAGAVLTSATLRAVGSFHNILQKTGLNRLPETATLALDSPFDFQKQGELYIPPLSANPKTPDLHTNEVVKWLPKLIDATAPVGTLVLFTSRRQMEEVAFRLPEQYQPLILMQGDRPKSQLIAEHYKALDANRPSIIFGLDSFAEGLDLPGNACVQVIIAKLPFAMPDDPVAKTFAEWIRQRGGNPFMEISVPDASIKLTQAVGRLIRTETDFGRVSILDTRLITAQYGKKLLDALPDFKRI